MVTESDEFGDFWFRKLDAGSYTLTIEAEGFLPVTRKVSLEKSLNVGDFPLERTADNPYIEKNAAIDLDGDAPEGIPDVEVKEVGEVTANFSVMSQASEEASRIG